MRKAAALLHIRSAWAAAVWYAVLTCAITWPLASGLAHDLPRDLGDPLLNSWILAWGASRLWNFITGDFTALNGFWTANIFYPETLTLAYSESLIPQVLQILPVYGLTKNIVLCYNLVFLSTFVLSGAGTYLFVREVTRDARAAFLAGALYAFAVYRVCQFSHVQVLSSQWMPFVLFGFRRYFETGRGRALAGAGLALWAQNLSCGYYLFFFPPFLGAYLLFELLARGLWRDRVTLVALATTLAATFGATTPFLLPYLELSARGVTRPLAEIVFYSADVFSYLTTFDDVRLWGFVAKVFPKVEGELFPGVTPVLLSFAGLAAWAWRNWRHAAAETRGILPRWPWMRWIAVVALAVLILYCLGIVVMMLRGRTVFSLFGARVTMHSIVRLVEVSLLALAVLLLSSARARAFARGLPGSYVGFFTACAVGAFFFSLGPRMTTMGQNIAAGPYSLLMTLAPGIDSVRVPARFAMLVTMFLAILGGLAVAMLTERWRRAGRAIAWIAVAVFLVEGWSAPIAINVRGYEEGLRLTEPGPMRQGDNTPPVYKEVAKLPAGTVLVEFPFGAFAYEFQYMFYSTNHWKPLVNGYSGFFPRSYEERRARFLRPSRNPDAAWTLISQSGATHAIVHDNAYADTEGLFTVQWLEQHGARLLGAFEYDRLYELPRAR